MKIQYYPLQSVPPFLAIHDPNPIRQYSRRIPMIRAYLNEIRRITTYPISTKYCFHMEKKPMAKGNVEFVHIELSRSDQPKVAAFSENFGNDIDEVLVDLLSAGYKIGLSFVDSRSAFCASLTGSDRAKVNKGLCLTSWSDDWREAIFLNAYKHYEICHEGDWTPHETVDNWG